jgi:hypothetical protein
MKKLICLTLLCFAPNGAWAGVVLGTSSPPGTPLNMVANTTSGLMDISVFSNNVPNDVMAAWQFRLFIVPDGGATGTLVFKDPVTSLILDPEVQFAPYVFPAGSLTGLDVTNTGSSISLADDFDKNLGTVVPAGAVNLLRVDFAASANASGLFHIMAGPGLPITGWTDDGGNQHDFDNVPAAGPEVNIGDVFVEGIAAVPEPSTLTLVGLGAATIFGWSKRRRGTRALQATPSHPATA